MTVARLLRRGLAGILRPLVLAGRRRMAGRRPVTLAEGVDCRLLGDPRHHTFFGYYDLSPFDPEGGRLLACRVARARPEAMEIGFYPAVEAGDFTPVAETETWCWQQGCRLAWAPQLGKEHILFNSLGRGRYEAAVFDLAQRREVTRLVAPVYDLSRDGAYGLSVNFARLQRLRPGYGYTALGDTTAGEGAPGGDGIWLLDVAANDARLLHSLAEVAAVAPQPSMAGATHYFNHLAWNPSGTRFLFFHIWEPPGSARHIRLLTSDARGNLRLVTNERMVSHYAWIDDRQMLLFAEFDGVRGYYELDDLPHGEQRPRRVNAMPDHDGHPTWNAVAGRFLFDSLPDRLSERSLMTYRPGNVAVQRLAAFYSPPGLAGERRCDLHPRWSRDGRRVAVDTAHAGYRQIAVVTEQL